jgi:hypothetical protein
MSSDNLSIKQDILFRINYVNFVLSSIEKEYNKFTFEFYNELYCNIQECLRDSKIILRAINKQHPEEVKNKYENYGRKYKKLFSSVFV